MIETKQLQIFKTIVDVGSFTGCRRAARHQSVGDQPADSRRSKEELGVALLVRLGRSTRMTPAGEAFLRCARQVLDKLDETRRFLDEHARGRAGVVRIGTPEPPCNYLLPEVLVELKRRFPKIDARVVSGHTAATLARLVGGELDIALLPLPIEVEKLRVDRGRTRRARGGRAARSRVGVAAVRDAARLRARVALVYDRASQITDLTLGFLLDQGVFPRIAVEVDHIEASEGSRCSAGSASRWCRRGRRGASSRAGARRRCVSGRRVWVGLGRAARRPAAVSGDAAEPSCGCSRIRCRSC